MTYKQVKPWSDRLLALLLLVGFSPIMLLIAIAIVLDSSGPVLFVQERLGQHGKPFKLFKFRSMYSGASSQLHRQHMVATIANNRTPEAGKTLKIEGDPRITRVGKILRSTSLDELPQLLNVLRGEMSVVGPRPPLEYEVQLYREDRQRRLDVRPGITGLWQVSARNQVNFEEMVRLDIDYIHRVSWKTDLAIILKTPLAMLSAKGAG